MVLIEPTANGISLTYENGKFESINKKGIESIPERVKHVKGKDADGNGYQLDVMLDTVGIGETYAYLLEKVGVLFRRKPRFARR